MGLDGDDMRRNFFVDTYGSEYGRDIEPTIDSHYGDVYSHLVMSCIRAYKKGGCAAAPNEQCCHVRASEILDQCIQSTFEKR
jgi:hypothetical protein